ncbi:MAG: helix-turn-helix transcriptional regulator [Candidatus Acidiferrales bacterium]
MVIGDKLKELRETKKLSQGDIERRTGLRRCYISRVENGHTVPSVDTLETMARALEVPMYRLFTDDVNVKKPNIAFTEVERARNAKRDSQLRPFAKAFSRMNDKDQRLLVHLAWKMANRTRKVVM